MKIIDEKLASVKLSEEQTGRRTGAPLIDAEKAARATMLASHTLELLLGRAVRSESCPDVDAARRGDAVSTGGV